MSCTNRANHPFQFFTASCITRVHNQTAACLAQLRDGLERCSDESIFHHTFQCLGRGPFVTETFSNDFAQWVLAGLNRPSLAEELAGLDIRSYVDLKDLRKDCLRVLDRSCRSQPDEAVRPALEPFYFCSSVEVPVPVGRAVWTLDEFRGGLEQAGHSSLRFHFLGSRLRLRLQSNDFSVWCAEELGLERLGRRVNGIDIWANSLDGVRARLLALVDRALAARGRL